MTAIARVAWIARAQCVGCALCIEACPFDAIAGMPQKVHAVLPALCTECALCLPACPVDCITLRPDPQHRPRDHVYRTEARDRVRQRLQRRDGFRAQQNAQLQQAHAQFREAGPAARQAAIEAAVERAQQRIPPD